MPERNSRVVDLILRGINRFKPVKEEVQDDLRDLQQTNVRLNQSFADNRQILEQEKALEKLRVQLSKASKATADAKNEQDKYRASLPPSNRRTAEQIEKLNELSNAYRANKNSSELLRREANKLNAAIGKQIGFGSDRVENLNRIKRAQNGLSEEVNRSNAALDKARASQAKFDAQQKLSRAGITRSIIVMNRFRSAMLSLAVVASAGLGFDRLARLFGDLERQQVAVQKVTSLTREEIQSLSIEFRNLSENVSGTDTTKLLEFAEVAGRLGIDGRDNLLDFAKTFDQLERSTQLVGEEGAESFGRLTTALEKSGLEFDRIASALVATGNNTAATEPLIARFATRLANVTVESQISTKNIFALAGTLARLNISAESGSTQIGRLVRDLRLFRDQGGEDLRKVSEITERVGISFEQLKTLSDDDLLGAFLKGLNATIESGQNASSVLQELGFNNERLLLVVPALSKAYETYNNLLDINNEAITGQNALTEEAIKAYAANNNQVARFTSSIKNAGIALGEAFSGDYLRRLNELRENVQGSRKDFQGLGQDTGKLFNSISNLTEAFLEFGRTRIVAGTLSAALDVLNGTVNLLSLSFNGLGQILELTNIGWNKLRGNQDEVARSQENLNRLQEQSIEIQKDLGNNVNDLIESGLPKFYRDFSDALFENAEAVKDLSAADQLVIESLQRQENAVIANREEYITLTNAIEKAAEIQRIKTELEKEAIDPISALTERLRARGVEEEKIQTLLTDQAAVAAEVAAREKELEQARLDLELKTKSLIDTEENRNESLIQNIKSEEQAIDAIKVLIQGINELEQARDEESIGLQKYTNEKEQLIELIKEVARISGLEEEVIRQLITANSEATDSTIEYAESMGLLSDETDSATNSLSTYVDQVLNTTSGISDARSKQQEFTKSIEENNKAFKNGEITLTEYNETNSELQRGLRALDSVIKDVAGTTEETAKSTEKVIEANERLVVSNVQAVTSYKELAQVAIESNDLIVRSATERARAIEIQLQREASAQSRVARESSEFTVTRTGNFSTDDLDERQQRRVDDIDRAIEREESNSIGLSNNNKLFKLQQQRLDLIESFNNKTESVINLSREEDIEDLDEAKESLQAATEQFEKVIEKDNVDNKTEKSFSEEKEEKEEEPVVLEIEKESDTNNFDDLVDEIRNLVEAIKSDDFRSSREPEVFSPNEEVKTVVSEEDKKDNTTTTSGGALVPGTGPNQISSVPVRTFRFNINGVDNTEQQLDVPVTDDEQIRALELLAKSLERQLG